MKISTILTSFLVLFTLASFNYKNNEKDNLEKFLVQMNDARLMDFQEGKLAELKGTTSSIKEYGTLMIKDQTFLLAEFVKVAKSKNIALPKTISNKKLKALKKLSEKSGKDFDKKFINMICIDHKRDVKKFTNATKYEDLEVSKFANKHLPMIESHLLKIEAIKKSN